MLKSFYVKFKFTFCDDGRFPYGMAITTSSSGRGVHFLSFPNLTIPLSQ